MKTAGIDPVRRDNRKALPKFILILILSVLVGGVIGFTAAWFGLDKLGSAFSHAGTFFSRNVAHWLLAALAVLVPAVSIPLYRSARGDLAGWDGENETVPDRVESKASSAMFLGSASMILSMFLVTACYSVGTSAIKEGSSVGMLIGIVAFVAVMAETIITQQKLVDLARRVCPEKKGSVYDAKFQKKWLDSCDEAEKIIIGQCAYKAYQAVSSTCLVLWLVLTLAALFFSIGFLPALVVCIIWMVSQVVYFTQAARLSKAGTSVL